LVEWESAGHAVLYRLARPRSPFHADTLATVQRWTGKLSQMREDRARLAAWEQSAKRS
jgi:hypothetical protein